MLTMREFGTNSSLQESEKHITVLHISKRGDFLLEMTRHLSNGLEISIEDQTRNYFGDYHRVRVVITAHIAIAMIADLSVAEREAATNQLGPTATYTKVLEKMGVGSADICSSRNDLLANFTHNSLPYLSEQSFPTKLVRSALQRSKHLRGGNIP